MGFSYQGDVTDWYDYEPSTPAAAVACVCFALGLVLHIWQMFRHKSWIWIVMILAVAMETLGYGIRVASTKDVGNKQNFVSNYVLIVMAPVLMTGIIYVVFGCIVFHVVPAAQRTARLLWVPPRWITPIFVGCDVISLFLQLVGAVMIAGTDPTTSDAKSKLQTGKDLALIGVSVQIAGFGLFSIIAARFHVTSRRFKAAVAARVRKIPGERLITMPGSNKKFRPHWERLLYAVNLSCALILMRSIYREIEFGQGKLGYSNTHEWVQYCFDCIPMILLVFLYVAFPPGRFVQMSFRQTKEGQQMRNVVQSAQSSDADVEMQGRGPY